MSQEKDIKNHIGLRLREERERLGLSQPALGEIGGVTKLTQLNYEKGKGVPDAAYLYTIHKALGINIHYILTGIRTPGIAAKSSTAINQRPETPQADDSASGDLFFNELNIKGLDMRKKRQDSFANDAEESVIERIAQLVKRHPSRSAAARAWGININTLNSYFKNDMPAPMPREHQLSKIAESEGVSLRWLTTGEGEPPKSQKTREHRDKLSEILDFLTEDERLRLATTLARKGVEAILRLLDEDNINSQKQNQSPAQPDHAPTEEEVEEMIMALPVRDSLKIAFARGIHASEAADKEILRILESDRRDASPDCDSVPSVTPDSALKQKNG